MSGRNLVVLRAEKHGETYVVVLGNTSGEVVDGVVVPAGVAEAFAKLLGS